MYLLKAFSKRLVIVFLTGFSFGIQVFASDHPVSNGKAAEEEFIAGEFILKHIKDSHEWHILTKKNGQPLAVYLPVILYSNATGLNFFMSNKIAHGQVYNRFRLSEETGKIVEINEAGETIGSPLDLSITKTVAAMIFAAVVILFLFLRMGRAYSRTKNIVPNGLNGFLEPMIVFIRDEIAIPNIGLHKYERFMPYLLTAFFFILVNNIMGLIPFFPFGANVTGNIAVTLTLAMFTLFTIQFSGNKNYWKHIFASPGVPLWLSPIMIPVEIIGLFVKPFALMIRLFANITAGHIIVLSLVSLIFIFKSLSLAAVSIVFVIFMDCLEVLVAFLQAYIFTLLSTLFISLAVQEHH
jgi:F-type H+-transporting ATPase subunit a